jgi:malate dehydrogenase (oxaloacetate-decarboxylating)(NADP+)
MVTGVTRSFSRSLEEVTRIIPVQDDTVQFGLSIAVMRGRTVFIADTAVHELPEPEVLVDITLKTAAKARQLGHEPRVALLSFSNFGQPFREKAKRIRDAVALLDRRPVDFEYDGEMSADVALDHELMRKHYPFCRLTGPANVLIMPALHTANIGSKLLQKMGGTVIGPLIMGLSKPVQIAPMDATVSDLVTVAALAAHDAAEW